MANEVVIVVTSKNKVDRRDTDRSLKDTERQFGKSGERSGDRFGSGFSQVLAKSLTASLGGQVSSGLMTAAKGLGATAAAGFAGQFLLVAGRALASGVAKLLHGLGALAAIGPAAGLAAVAAFGTLKLALSGVADVFSAGLTGDVEKFEELLKGLSPAAQRFAREVVGLKGRLDGLKRTAQENFFAPMLGSVQPLADRYLPSIERTVAGIARGFGDAGRQTADFLLLPGVGDQLDRALMNVTAAVRNVVQGLPSLVEGFVPLVAVGSEFLPQLTRGFDQMTARFAEWMNDIAASGQLRDFIAGGLEDLEQLGGAVAQTVRTIGNFASGIGDLFSRAEMPTHGVADALERISEQFRAWAGTAAAQERVRDIVEFLSNVDWGQIAQVAAALSAVSFAFKTFSGVGGLMQGISALAALGPVGLIILGVATALAVLVGGLVFAYKESESFRSFVNDQLLPALREFGAWFEEHLLPALEKVGEFIGTEMARAWGYFTDTVARNWPELQKVGNLLREIAEVVGPPLLMMLGAIALGWIGVLVAMSIVVEVIGQVVRAFESVKSWLSDNWPALFGIITGPISMAIGWILSNLVNLIQGFNRALDWVRGNWHTLFGVIVNPIQGAVSWVIGTLNALVEFLRGLPGRVGEALSGLWDGLTPPSILGSLGGLPGVGGGRLPGRPTKGFAHGGIAGGLSRVAERAAELMSFPGGGQVLALPQGTTVHSGSDTSRMLAGASGGSGGTTVNVYVQGSIRSDRDLVKVIRDELDRGGFG